jgi:hypothetical protein
MMEPETKAERPSNPTRPELRMDNIVIVRVLAGHSSCDYFQGSAHVIVSGPDERRPDRQTQLWGTVGFLICLRPRS